MAGSLSSFLSGGPLSPIPELRSPQIAHSRLPAPGPPGGGGQCRPRIPKTGGFTSSGVPDPPPGSDTVELIWDGGNREVMGRLTGKEKSLKGDGNHALTPRQGPALNISKDVITLHPCEGPTLEHKPEIRHTMSPETVQHSDPERHVSQKGRWDQRGRKSLIDERDIQDIRAPL